MNTLSKTKPSICIKDMKSHEETHNYYKNLAIRYNNSPAKEHKQKKTKMVFITKLYDCFIEP